MVNPVSGFQNTCVLTSALCCLLHISTSRLSLIDNSSITVQNQTLILFYTSTPPQTFFILVDASYLFAQAILHRFPVFLISLPHLSPKLSLPT